MIKLGKFFRGNILNKKSDEEVRIDFMYPKTAKEALDKFEMGGNVFVPELGGFGPSYELGIWFSIFRVIKKYHNKDLSHWIKNEKFTNASDNDLSDAIRDLGYGLSGAQAGAIKSFSYKVITQGWRKFVKEIPQDKLIQVCKYVPQWREHVTIED